MEQEASSTNLGHQQDNSGRLDKAPQNQAAQDPLANLFSYCAEHDAPYRLSDGCPFCKKTCPKCGGREWVVEPGLTGIVFSMPCPVCNGEAA